MPGLIAYGAYVPYHRLKRAEIAAVLGEGGGKGSRSVASFDEDPTSMAVEAGRHALRGRPMAWRRIDSCSLLPTHPISTRPTPTSSTPLCDLDPRRAGRRRDRLGPLRGGRPALAAESPGRTTGHPRRRPHRPSRRRDEREGGDAAAAFVFGDGRAGRSPRCVAQASRPPRSSSTGGACPARRRPGCGRSASGSTPTLPLADDAFADALKQAGMTPGEVDVLVVAGTHGRAVQGLRRRRRCRQGRRRPGRSHGRQHRHRPPRARAGQRARPGPAGADHRPGRAGRRRRRDRAAHDRRHRLLPARADGRRADRREATTRSATPSS